VDNDIFIAEIPLTDHVPEKSNVGGLNGGLSGGLSGGLKIELNETQQKVFLEITKRPGVMIKELSGRLQMPIDTLDKVVSSLRKKELIERRGSKKTGGYWVKKEPTSTNW
jgi:ATP-dependent DNA helicase RecG